MAAIVVKRLQVSALSGATKPLCTRTFTSTARTPETVKFQVEGIGTGGAQHLIVPDTPYEIKADTYKQFGGNESAPSPLHLNLAALSSCTQVSGAITAKDLGIRVEQWKVAVDGDWDPAVLVTGAGGNANWQSILLKVNVVSDADDAKFQQWAEDTERRCPVSQLFKRSGVKFESHWQNEKSV